MTSILQAMERGRYVEGEIIVKFKRDHRSSAQAIHRVMGSTILKRFSMLPEIEVVKLPEGLSIRDGIIKYMSDPSVEYAEPNYIRRINRIPNDTYFNQQWALLNTGQFNGTPGSDIKATDAWDINAGTNSVVIAVIDTGMDYNHPDLIKNRWVNEAEIPDNGLDDDGNGKIDDRYGWDFTTCAKFDSVTGRCSIPKSQDRDPMDDNGHGTHVSGIIGASGNNGTGISGVMWDVRIMPLKILNADGEGSIADEIAALDYIVMMKNRGVDIKAINASFGGSVYSSAEYDAISKVNNAGIIFVTAAGNGGDDGIGDNNDIAPSYPGNYNLPNIIAVAATDQNDNLAPFSNYGLNNVHVAAPGVHILSIVPGGLYYYSGTSMATPHVTGLVGLLYSEYPLFSPSQIKSTIMRYVDILPSLSGKIKSGGRINAYKALSSLLSPSGLRANNISSNSISLQWTDRATGEDGYKLERRTGNSPYSLISALPSNSGSFQDVTVTDGTSYSYRVRAYNDIAESNYSDEVVAVTPLKAPSNLSVTAGITDSTLTWTDNSASEEGFRIERKGPDGAFVMIATVGANITTYRDGNLQPSTTYTYRVKAFNSVAGESSPIEATVTTGSQSTEKGSSGGGGGCSVMASGSTVKPDLSLFVLLFFIYVIRRLKR
ncbi:MAG: S8 family serine peptidase [Thermodesulfovibrionales bacterium]